MSSVLITGANRGIGLEMVKEFLAHPNPPSPLIATCRNPEAAKDLRDLAAKHSSLHIVKFDVVDFNNYENIALKIKEIVGDKGLNVLINNAGIMIGRKFKLSEVNVKDMTDTYLTNTVAPVMLIKTLRPLLRRASDNNKGLPMGWARAAIINISSDLGSLTTNTMGGFWEYRQSKAALNIACQSLALEFGSEGILVLNVHPGWVKTDLGGSDAHLTVQESAGSMVKVFYNLKPEHHGKFVQWDGEEHPW